MINFYYYTWLLISRVHSYPCTYFAIITGDLVHNLATSSDKTSTSAAIRNADDYLCRESKAAATGRPSGLDRTVINRDPPRAKNTGHGSAAAAPTDDMGIVYSRVAVLPQLSFFFYSGGERDRGGVGWGEVGKEREKRDRESK